MKRFFTAKNLGIGFIVIVILGFIGNLLAGNDILGQFDFSPTKLIIALVVIVVLALIVWLLSRGSDDRY